MSVTVEQMQARVSRGLTMRSRAGYTLVLVAATGMAALTGALALTEPDLPRRTLAALGVLTLIGVAWAVLAGWVLARRHVLFAQHRIAAAWLAVGAAGVFLVGTAALRDRLPWAAPLVGALMLAAAALCLTLAYRYRARLIARREELQKVRA